MGGCRKFFKCTQGRVWGDARRDLKPFWAGGRGGWRGWRGGWRGGGGEFVFSFTGSSTDDLFAGLKSRFCASAFWAARPFLLSDCFMFRSLNVSIRTPCLMSKSIFSSVPKLGALLIWNLTEINFACWTLKGQYCPDQQGMESEC